MAEYTVVRLERHEPVAEVILNNPERLNAMGANFFPEIRQAFEEDDGETRTSSNIARGNRLTKSESLPIARPQHP
jgi:enoyl-CoA hydratase/carnithine racemase